MRSLDVLLLLGLIAPVMISLRQTAEHWKMEVSHDENDIVATDEEDETYESEADTTAGGKVGLIVVDVQDCFTENGIGLGNPRGGAEFKNNVKSFVKKVRDGGGAVVLLQDYHPKEHISF